MKNYLIILGMLFSISFAFGQMETPVEEKKPPLKVDAVGGEPLDNEGVITTFAKIEDAWRKREIENLESFLGERVQVSFVKGGPRGGTLLKAQAIYLLSDIFKYTLIEKFEFTKYENMREGSEEVTGIADRSYKLEKDGLLYEDKLSITLKKENGRWVIVEIKSVEK